MSNCFCHFNGYEVKDAAARQKVLEVEGRVASLEAGAGSGGSGGAEIRICPDCDAALTDGFYHIAVPASNVPDDFTADSVLLVQANDNVVHQTITDANITARRFYIVATGAWSEWEYENPPYKANKVYRTTERFKGHPVYAVNIACGMAVHGDTQVTLSAGIVGDPEFEANHYEWTVISCDGSMYDGFYHGMDGNDVIKTGDYPIWSAFSSIKAMWSANGLTLNFSHKDNNFANTSEGDTYITVKFIKKETY